MGVGMRFFGSRVSYKVSLRPSTRLLGHPKPDEGQSRVRGRAGQKK